MPHDFSSPEQTPLIADFGGGDYVARYTTSTHDKTAYLTTKPAVIHEMVAHYAAKIARNIDDITLVKRDLLDGADILVISYGITSRSAAVAVREARAAGRKVSSLVLQTLWPVPEKEIRKAMSGVNKVVVPEMNMGQYVLEIERLAVPPVEVVGVNKMDTTLVSPGEIITRGGLL
jgi:2-oxoglutarate ferredoxin oxidoreductase subunit alpha